MLAEISRKGREESGVSDRGVTVTLHRGADGRLLPMRRAVRAQRVRDAARRAWSAARGRDMDELAAAYDYARSSAAAASRGGEDPGSDIRQATRLLWAMGDALTERLGAGDA
jgi:hypothetical protein